jgi:hypothetical protein
MKASELRKGMVLTIKATGEQWELSSQKCYIFSDGERGSTKQRYKVHVDNHRKNKWMVKRLSDGEEAIFCFNLDGDITRNIDGLEWMTVDDPQKQHA